MKISVSIAETASDLGICRGKVYELIGSGKLVTIRIGRRRLVRVDSIDAFVEAHTVNLKETETNEISQIS